jgi:hypothetical protein
LPSEGIRIYGVDGSRPEQAQKTIESSTAIKILDEQITFSDKGSQIGIRWLQGSHPQLGTIISEKRGLVTIQRFTKAVD